MLYREHLSTMPCGSPGCDHTAHSGPMYLHAQCHRGASLELAYAPAKTAVECRCRVCRQFVVEVAIAPPPWLPRRVTPLRCPIEAHRSGLEVAFNADSG